MNSNHRSLAFALLRITVGLNFLMHGAVRVFGDLGAFVGGITKGFEGILPAWTVTPYAYILTFVELIGGLFLVLGFKTPKSAAALMMVMMSLIFGKSLQQEWGTVGSQMIYSFLLFVIVFLSEYDRWGISSRGKE